MKKLLLPLLFLLLTLLPASAAKRIEANPINIAVSIAEKTDSAKIASTLDYYGYTLQGTEDGYTVMKDPKGNEIRYTFEPSNKYPTVTVKTHDSHQAIDTRLKDMSFDKTGDSYQKVKSPHSQYKTHCSFGPHNTLIFRRIQQ